jgi:hypothetical protein
MGDGNRHCSCGNTLFVRVDEFDHDTGISIKTDGVVALVCTVCGHYHEFNIGLQTWKEFAWDGAQRKWVVLGGD